MSFYTSVRKLLGGLFRKLYRIELEGAENLPVDGGLLLCANHTANTDVLVLAAALPRPINYMAKAELFKIPGLKQLIRAFGAFPVRRGTTDTKAIKQAVSLIEGGEVVGMFPQGKRYKKQDFRKTEVKNGAGMIAYRAKCTVLPVFIATKNNQVHIFRKTKIIIGKPIPFEALPYENGTMREYEAASQCVFEGIAALSDGADLNTNKGMKTT